MNAQSAHTVTAHLSIHPSASLAPHPLPIDPWSVAAMVLLGAMIWTAGAYVFARNHKIIGRQGYRITPFLNVIAAAAAAYLAQYPFQADWFPKSVPSIAEYPLQLFGWFLAILVILRFSWSMCIMLDRHALFLTGDQRDLDPGTENKILLESSSQNRFQDAQVGLFDPLVSRGLISIKATGSGTEAENYVAAWRVFIAKIVLDVPSFHEAYDLHVYRLSDITHAPEPYQRLVEKARNELDPVLFRDRGAGGEAIAYVPSGKDYFILIVAKHNEVVRQEEFLELVRHFDACWAYA